MISVEDADLISRNVSLDTEYPSLWENGKNVNLHRLIAARMFSPDEMRGMQVDHISGSDTLEKRCDARRSNLQLLTNAQNTQKQTKAHGNKKSDLPRNIICGSRGYGYRARIKVGEKQHYSTTRRTVNEAVAELASLITRLGVLRCA